MISTKETLVAVFIVASACVNKATADVDLTTDINKKIVEFGGKVLSTSAAFAMQNFGKPEVVLNKLLENALAHKEVNFPADLFEAVLHNGRGLGGLDQAGWQTQWYTFNKAPKKAETYIGKALEIIPLHMVASNGIDVGKELEKAMPGWQSGKKIDKTKFDPLFKPSRFTLESNLGEGEFGSVYLMTDKAARNNDPKEVALKIIPWKDKTKLPNEITLHEELAKVAALKSFIPAFIDKGQCANVPFTFVVMERIGPILMDYTNVREKGVNNAWATKEETMEIVARMYLILQEFHKAGFYHGDNLVRNWALKIGDENGLILYDFGTSKQMKGKGDFGWVAADLWRWTEVSKQIISDSGGPVSPIAEAGKMLSGGTKLMTALQEELKKVLWVNPVHPLRQLVSPLLHDVKYADYEAFMGKSVADDPDFKTGAQKMRQFRKLWADWLKLTGYPANGGKKIHHW